MDFKFSNYEIVPCGSTSLILARRSNNKIDELPLYGSGGWRPFGQPLLDQTLVAYMDCFCQLEAHLKTFFQPVFLHKNFKIFFKAVQILPYRMIKDKIIDKDSQYLIKMQLNSEERWTKAMKCLLLNLKRVIAILPNIRSP